MNAPNSAGSANVGTLTQILRSVTPSDMPKDIERGVPKRLSYVGFMAAVLLGLLVAVGPLRDVEFTTGRVGMHVLFAVGIVVSLVVGFKLRKGEWERTRVTGIGLAYHVFIGVLVWVLELSVPFGDVTHTPGVPTVSVWLLVFPMLVPAPAKWSAIANALIVLAGPVVMWGFVRAGQPDVDFARALLWFIAAAVTAGVGTAASARLYGVEKKVTELRTAGSYRLIEPLRSGGMGTVWRAQHKMLARPAAIKMIRADQEALTSTATRRFAREAQATAALRSPHTVELYDFGNTEDGTLYYVMELLEGVDLEHVLSTYGRLAPERVAHIALQVCESLAEAHSVGILHRDIKPGNIHLGVVGGVPDFAKVLDFGIAAWLPPSGARHEDDLEIIGTPGFMSPQALDGVLEPSGDIYALGCVMYRALTGDPVFSGEAALEIIIRHRDDEPLEPTLRAPGLKMPPALEDLVMRCLSKTTADRPSSAAAMATELREILREHPWDRDEAMRWWKQTHGDERDEIATAETVVAGTTVPEETVPLMERASRIES